MFPSEKFFFRKTGIYFEALNYFKYDNLIKSDRIEM